MAMRVVLVFVALLLVSCASSPTEPLASLAITTDHTSYALGQQITVEIRNDTAADAFFGHCDHRFPHVIQQRVEGQWVDHESRGWLCPAIYPNGIEVLLSGHAKLMAITVEHRGTYRIVFQTGSQSRLIGTVTVASNAFEVH